jgi:hypothetical protein
MATDDAVTTITESLKETDELPRRQIAEIVEVLGPDVALSLLNETLRVQSEGGVEVRDGTRRRTDGGVFFSLAKTKLPRADRNRIFRIRPPKPPEEQVAEGASPAPAPAPPERAPEAPVRPLAREERPRPPQAPPAKQQVPAGAGGPLGRRRVVEVEVLRQHARPALERVPEVRAPIAAPRQVAAVREERPEPQEVRPLRRIVTVAPVVKEEAPPSTPEAAIEKMRASIRGLKVAEQRRAVLDLLREIGGLPEPEKRPPPEPKKVVEPPRPQGLDAPTKERVLASVTDALGLSTADLAEVLYGDATPATRAKARGVLDRFRKS